MHAHAHAHVVLAAPIDCTVDLIIVLEAIDRITFAFATLFLSESASRLDINGSSTRVGFLTYSTEVGPGFNLSDHTDVDSLQSAIMSLSYVGGSTNTAAALAHVRTTMLTSSAGDRSDVPNVVAVITGRPSDNMNYTKVSINICIV